ncbi:MAG: phage tail protein [Bryobacteraceae bacterium]
MGALDFKSTALDYTSVQYLIEIRDGGGRLICYARDLITAKMEERINQPEILRLSCALDNDLVSALAGRNEIWVRRRNEAMPEKVFIFATLVENTEGATAEVTAYGRMWQMSREPVLTYDTGAGGKTVDAIVNDLLALQTWTRPIAYGTIDTVIGDEVRVFKVENGNLFKALMDLAATIEQKSHIRVDVHGALIWTVADETVENHITTRRDIKGLQRTVDSAAVATRLYAFGKNEGGARVCLSSATGSTQDYIESDDAPWSHYQQIIINPLEVTPDPALRIAGVAEFALWISEASNDGLARYAMQDGSDIAFFDTDGNKLDIEIVSFDHATGALACWVKVWTVSATVDTVIYLRFGDSGVGGSGTVDHSGAGKSSAWLATAAENQAHPETFYSVGHTVTGYGVISDVRIYDTITDADALMSLAVMELARISKPHVAYKVSLMDQDAYRLFKDRVFTLGRYQRIVDTALALDTTEAIVRMDRNLLDPVDVTMEIGDFTRGVKPDGTIEADPVVVVADKVSQIESGGGFTDWLPDESIIIDNKPVDVAGYPSYGGQPAKLSDWEYKKPKEGGGTEPTGLIDGNKVHGMTPGGGSGTGCEFYLDAEHVHFAEVASSGGAITQNFTIVSKIDNLAINIGTHSGDANFALVGFTPTTLAANATLAVTIRFTPPAADNAKTYAKVFNFTTSGVAAKFSVLATARMSGGLATYTITMDDAEG